MDRCEVLLQSLDEYLESVSEEEFIRDLQSCSDPFDDSPTVQEFFKDFLDKRTPSVEEIRQCINEMKKDKPIKHY